LVEDHRILHSIEIPTFCPSSKNAYGEEEVEY
jgi:hypothetical protein